MMLTIAAIVGVVSVVNVLLPAINRAGYALVSSADVADDRLSSRIEIIHATGQDTATQAEVWVKNTGVSRLVALTRIDVFFGPSTNYARIPSGGTITADPPVACSPTPCFKYEIENDTEWGPTATLHIVIFLTDPLAAGNTYYVKVVAPNGVEDAKFFTL